MTLLLFYFGAAFAQDVSIHESLAEGAPSASVVQGGTFTGAGWRVDDASSRLYWDFGTQVATGEISVVIDDISWDNLTGANNHVIELFDAGDHWSCTRAINLRLYGAGDGTASDRGQMKLKVWDPTMAAEARADAIDWSGGPHLFRITWDESDAVLYVDGAEAIRLDVRGIDTRVGTLWLPLASWTGDYSAPVGSVYSTLALDAWEPGEAPDPADDGDPDTLTPTDDVTAAAWEGGVYSDRADLSVEGDGGASTAVSYLRFDLSGRSGWVERATLELRARADGSAAGDGGVVYAVADSTWSEDSLTWAVRPALGPSLASFPAVEPDRLYTLDVTAGVRTGGPVTLALAGTGANGAHFSSKEDADATRAPVLRLVLSEGDDTGAGDSGGDAGGGDSGGRDSDDEGGGGGGGDDAGGAHDSGLGAPPAGGCGCVSAGPGSPGFVGFVLVAAAFGCGRRRGARGSPAGTSPRAAGGAAPPTAP